MHNSLLTKVINKNCCTDNHATRARNPSSNINSSVSATGRPAARNAKKNSTSTAMQERQLLEQHQVLLVLQQRTMQQRNGPLWVLGAQRLGRDVLRHQQLDPIQQFGSGRFLLEARCVADAEERRQCLGQQLLLEPRKVDLDDAAHRGIVGEADIVKKAAPQEGIGEFLLRSEEHTSELQSLRHLVCRLLLGKKKHKSELQSLRHLVCRLLLEQNRNIC